MSSARDRDKSQERPNVYDKEYLNTLLKKDLLDICDKQEICNVTNLTKLEIIALILGETGHSVKASVRASSRALSARASSVGRRALALADDALVVPRFVETLTAKGPPPKGRTVVAYTPRGGQIEAGVFDSLTAGSIAEMSAPTAEKTRRDQWQSLCTTLGHQPWDDINLLKQGIDLRMNPENPIQVSDRRPMFVVTAAPPGSGKSTVSDILHISKDSMINVDPDDAFNEFFVEMFGSFPPKTDDACEGWWGEHKQEFRQYEKVNLRVGRINVRPLAPKCCIAKMYNITAQYGTILDKAEVMDHIFDKATLGGGRERLDIVFNTTGGGMSEVIDKYIARATRLDYDIVVVGIYSTSKNCSDRAAHRNTQQHRRMEPFLVSILNTKFKHDQTIFKWEEKSRTHAYRLVLLENNGTPQNKAGAASIVFDRKADGNVVVAPRGVLLTSGFYGMKPKADGTFVGRDEVEKEAAEAAKAAKAAKAAASKHGVDGGSSRKRRISRRRIHGSRARKTIKKYSRPVTRRHRRH